jgi:hypothetical protein
MQSDLNRLDYERFIRDSVALTDEFREKYQKKCGNFEKELNKLKEITGNIAQKMGDKDKKPVILAYLIKNAIDFWKADLFFKHQIKVNLNLPAKDLYVLVYEYMLTELIDAFFFLNIETLKKAKEKGNHELIINIELALDKDNPEMKILTISNNCENIEIEEFPAVINLNSISGFIINNFAEKLNMKLEIFEKSLKITM